MSIAALIRRMADAGAPAEAIALAVEAIEAAQAKDDARRGAQAERKRRSRDKSVTVTGQSRDMGVTPSSPLVPPASLSPETPIPPPPYNPPTTLTKPNTHERDFVAEMQEAGGAAIDETSMGTHMPSNVLAWLEGGADFDLDVLPVIRAHCARRKPRSVRSWAYFTQAVTDARDRRLSGLPPVRPQHFEKDHGRPQRNRSNLMEAADKFQAFVAGRSPDDDQGIVIIDQPPF